MKEIFVTYDDKEKVHLLPINFKLHVIMENNEKLNPASVVVKPPKAGRKSHDQNSAVGDYSTVTDLARLRGWSTLQPRNTAI